MRKIYYLFVFMALFIVNGCSVYNFTGTGKIDAKPFKLAFFQQC
jgi:hypothetical protein